MRARVNGVVLKRLFTEGAEVKAGQALFQIDAAPYRAAYESALAQMAKAQANLSQAAAQAERNKPLVEAKAISHGYRRGGCRQAGRGRRGRCSRRHPDRQVERRLRGIHHHLRPHRSGAGDRRRAGQRGRGDAVGTDPTDLVRLRQLHPIGQRGAATAPLAGQRPVAQRGADAAQVRIVLDDGNELARPGKLLFTDLSVDASSGQVTLRAEVSNADGNLLPGQYVRVRLTQAEQPSAVLLPQQAVTRSGTGDTVLVVGADNKPVKRQIKIAQAQGSQWLVQDGLKPGEQVIVDGFQKMFVPGAPVKPVAWSPAASAATPAAATASAR
ncbi:efflux RND transporter periplasmic adaptor subunit [Roseateles sp. GG27B]